MTASWKVTAGRGNIYVSEFLSRGVVAIGWRDLGDVTTIPSRESLLARARTVFPDDTPRQVEVGMGQVWRFLREIDVGDTVVTYDPATRLYHVGIIAGCRNTTHRATTNSQRTGLWIGSRRSLAMLYPRRLKTLLARS